MLLSELDGFLAGIIVSPDTIMPSQWMPMIWGQGDNEDDDVVAFENGRQAEELISLILEHYNAHHKGYCQRQVSAGL